MSDVLWQKGPFQIRRRSMTLVGKTQATISQIKSAAKDALNLRDSGAWAIGDLTVYAVSIGKENAIDEISEEIVRDRNWVRKCYYVSKAIAPDMRHHDLWWTFYYAVYTFPEEIRERLLKLCVKNQWSLDEFKQHLRSLRHNIRTEQQTFPEGQYGFIYADPPWKHDNGSTDPSRQIDNQYPPMELAEIIALTDGAGRTVQDLTAKDCILYLWTCSPKLEEAFEVIRAWGFEYKSSMIWDKQVTGMGYWARIRHEILLIAVKGDVVPPSEDVRPDSIIVEQRGEHSAKPTQVYDIIERCYPKLPKLELFARGVRDGWDAWGNQLPAAEATSDMPIQVSEDAESDDTAVEADAEQRTRDSERGKKKKTGKNAGPRLVKSKKSDDAQAAAAS